METRNHSVGACWLKTTKNGNTWLSTVLDLKTLIEKAGSVEKVRLGIFENTKKQSDNSPDYRIMFFEDSMER